jgi:peptidoglycan/LPS O-acetylase OafA/YrhL
VRYSPPLDGIRAISILAVLLFHVSPNALTGGFTGVDVFFVLSGFLITSIVLHDMRAGAFSMREFYLRRIQRLLPNVIITVLAVLVLWSWLLPPSTARQTGSHGLWALVNLSNVFIWKNLGGYWGNAAEFAPLTHTWSLGVEEQFYLVFPVSMLLLMRLTRHRLTHALVVVAATSLAFCIYQTSTSPSAAFYLLPSRVWELLLGAALASSALTITHARSREVMGALGLVVLLASFVLIDERSAFPGVVALAPTLGAALMLVAVTSGDSYVSRLLSTRVMVGTGRLSYSLYLWHWPLITLGKLLADLYGYAPLAGSVAGGLVGVLLSVLAYVCVEQPLRQRGPGRPWRLAVIGAGFALTLTLSATVASRTLVADPQHRFDPTEFHGTLFDSGKIAGMDLRTIVRYYDVTLPPVPTRPDDVWRSGGIVHAYGGGQPQVVVLGSSHALMYSRVIDDLCRELGISVAFLGIEQKSAFFEDTPGASAAVAAETREFNEKRRQLLRGWRPDAVIVIDRWDTRMISPESFDSRLRGFLSEVSPIAGRVLWVAQAPVLTGGDEINFREYVNWRMRAGQGLPALVPNWAESLRRQTVAIAERAGADFPGLRIVRADQPFYLPDGSVRYVDGRRFLYADDDHVSDAGSDEARPVFRAAIIDAVRASRGPNEP